MGVKAYGIEAGNIVSSERPDIDTCDYLPCSLDLF